jgi:hypothetical protein
MYSFYDRIFQHNLSIDEINCSLSTQSLELKLLISLERWFPRGGVGDRQPHQKI